jgi:5-bromo-4-chloroindolyl phosphate hydrolysis protein
MAGFDYDKIQSEIENAVNGFKGIVDSAKTMMQKGAWQPPQLYKKTDSELSTNRVKSSFGYGLALAGGAIALLAGTGVMAGGLIFGTIGTIIAGGVMIAAGIPMGVEGTKGKNRVERFKNYVSVIGSKTTTSLKALSEQTGRSIDYLKNDLKDMMSRRYFTQGHFTDDETELITSDETYQYYRRAQDRLIAEQKENAAKDKSLKASGLTELGISIVKEGEDYIRRIHQANDELPGEEISEKLDTLENTIRRILQELKSQPDKAYELRKLMNYYLPTTWKLINSYQEIYNEPVKTPQMEKMQKEIETTLDTINDAFIKLLDQIFQNKVIDLTSDMSVLNTMLRMDNLVNDMNGSKARRKKETEEPHPKD